MEARRNNPIAPSIKVRDMQKSLDFYTRTLGLQLIDKLILKDGKIAHALVGFDSTVIMLSPVDHVRTLQTEDELAKNKLGNGIRFCMGLNGSRQLDEFFTEVKAKGITVINEPKTELWSVRLFTVEDPDSNSLTFAEHVDGATPEAEGSEYERIPEAVASSPSQRCTLVKHNHDTADEF